MQIAQLLLTDAERHTVRAYASVVFAFVRSARGTCTIHASAVFDVKRDCKSEIVRDVMVTIKPVLAYAKSQTV